MVFVKGHIPWNKKRSQSEETKRKLSKFTKEQELQICKEYFSKKKPSITDLGKKWDCGSTTIRDIIIRNGYKLRTRSEASKGEKNSFYGHHHSEENKQKRREKTIQQIKNYLGPFKNTAPELMMKKLLNDSTIPFEHQYCLGNHLYDFHISNTKILIEVDGDYWHGNPKKFAKLNSMQLKQKERDKKHDEVALNSGFILLRFWEDDILNNAEKVIEILKGVLLNGVGRPV